MIELEDSQKDNSIINKVFTYIEEKELQNLQTIVQGGATLSATQHRRLKELQAKLTPGSGPGNRWEVTLADLCEFYGLGISTLTERMKLSGFPKDAKTSHGHYDLKIVNDWTVEHFHAPKKEKTTMSAEKLRFQKARADREEFITGQMKQNLVPLDKLLADLKIVVGLFRNSLLAWYKTLPPLLIGRDEREISATLRQEAISILDEISKDFYDLTPERDEKGRFKKWEGK